MTRSTGEKKAVAAPKEIESKPKAKRGNPAWVKGGESPNPGGRPKVIEAFRLKARAAVDEHVLQAWIDEILPKPRAVRVAGEEVIVTDRGPEWMRAAELLAAYGYGRPTQPLSDSDGSPLTVVTHLYLPDNGRGTK
jgi:hypothetical protein